MTSVISIDKQKGFEWVDMAAPDQDEILKLAPKYGLLPESIEDALQPDHLPKYERLKNYKFVIIRIYNVQKESDADTVRELTNKIAVFISDNFIISVHKHEWDGIEKIKSEFSGDYSDPSDVLNEIVKMGLRSFDEPAVKLNRTIDYFEEHVFLKDRKTPLLKSLYFLKRKVDVIRRILLLTYDVVDYVDSPETNNAYTRDIRDLYIKQQSLFDGLAENTNHLLAIYFNISAQRTNEIIRVLTIFSVFFMPLTFIVGVYGMNFDFMPELKSKWGYPLTWLAMFVVVVVIYMWFKRKKWL
jgi:magnesium transporter